MLIHPDIARKMAGFLQPASRPDTAEQPLLDSYGLTKAELAVVSSIAEGLTNKEIAGKLFLSEGTVKNYITDILSKLGLRDRTQIAIFYLKSRREK
ncbi:Transcriptional regulatory protein DevR (DosR) [compost metagenome]